MKVELKWKIETEIRREDVKHTPIHLLGHVSKHCSIITSHSRTALIGTLKYLAYFSYPSPTTEERMHTAQVVVRSVSKYLEQLATRQDQIASREVY
jgi:hypothetical protein